MYANNTQNLKVNNHTTKICKTIDHKDTYILVTKRKPFRELSKCKISPGQPNPGDQLMHNKERISLVLHHQQNE